MIMLELGDIVKFKKKYRHGYAYGIVCWIHKTEFLEDDGWISFDYVVMTDIGTIVHITEGCVERVYSPDPKLDLEYLESWMAGTQGIEP